MFISSNPTYLYFSILSDKSAAVLFAYLSYYFSFSLQGRITKIIPNYFEQEDNNMQKILEGCKIAIDPWYIETAGHCKN